MGKVTMRACSDGGFSRCAAAEENVGKGRCNHIPDSLSFELKTDKLGSGITEVCVPQEFVDMPKKDKLKFASSIVDNLEPIDEKKAQDVIAQIRNL